MLLFLDVHVVQKVMWAGIHSDWSHFGADVCSLLESKNYRRAKLVPKRLVLQRAFAQTHHKTGGMRRV